MTLPPNFNTSAKALAILEAASHDNEKQPDPEVTHIIDRVSTLLVKYIDDWSRTQAVYRGYREDFMKEKKKKRGLLGRIAMATFGGYTFL